MLQDARSWKKEYFKDHEWKYLIYLRYGNTLTNQQNAGGSNRAREHYQYSLSKSTTSTCSTRVPIPSSSTNARTDATTGIAHYKLRVICNYSILGSCNFLILIQSLHTLFDKVVQMPSNAPNFGAPKPPKLKPRPPPPKPQPPANQGIIIGEDPGTMSNGNVTNIMGSSGK